MAGVENFDPVPFDDSEAVEFDDSPVPAGDYELRLVGASGGTYKTGTPKVGWEFLITEGEYEGRRLWHDTPTTGRGAGMFKAVVISFGYDFDEWFEGVGRQIDPPALAGLIGEETTARVRVNTPDEEVLEQYPNARPRNEVQRFL